MARHIVGNTSLILDTGRLVRPGDPVTALGGDTDPIQEGHGILATSVEAPMGRV